MNLEYEQRKEIIFAVEWKNRNERTYYSKSAMKLKRVIDSMPFYVAYDINPPNSIKVEAWGEIPEDGIQTLITKFSKQIERLRKIGILA